MQSTHVCLIAVCMDRSMQFIMLQCCLCMDVDQVTHAHLCMHLQYLLSIDCVCKVAEKPKTICLSLCMCM